MEKMYTLSVTQIFKYKNVILEKHKHIESPWVPRNSEYIYHKGNRGKIVEITHSYISQPQVNLQLEDVQEDRVFRSSDLKLLEDYVQIYAFVEGTAPKDKTLVYSLKAINFDEKAFDEKFAPKDN